MSSENKITRRTLMEAAGGLVAVAAPAASLAQTSAPHPWRLWYRQPADKWVEALPVGNGRLGAMVFGGVARERLQLNEDTLWGGGPYNPVNPQAREALPQVRRLIDEARFAEAQSLANERLMARPLSQMSYQTVGDLLLETPGLDPATARDYRRELDLDTAMAVTSFSMGGTRFRRRVVASPTRQVIAVQVDADRPGRIDLDLGVTTPQRASATVQERDLVLAGRNLDEHGVAGALRFEARVRVLAEGGAVEGQGDRVRVRGADRVTLLIAVATSYRRFDDVGGDPASLVRARIDQAAGAAFDQIAAETAREHQRLFRAVSLDLGQTPAAQRPTDERIRDSERSEDPQLAALYFQYGRYLLISSSRPGSQPANLQGIWNDSVKPPWGSKYTININTEMNYWPAELTGLAECTQPLIAMVRDLAQTGARTAREMYGARGWVAHHNTDLWRATAPIDGAQWGLWPTGGAWLCTHLWDRYDYGRDRAFLAEAYPLMRGAAEFFLDVLHTDPKTGELVTSPSLSPENAHPFGASVCAGPAMDSQILRDLFDQTAAAAGILNIDAEFVARVRAARARLPADRIGAQGQLQEWRQDWDAAAPEPNHRHVSHLYGLFPSHQINPDDTPALAAAARRSLEIRGDESTGWATAWRANLWARLRDGEHAHQILRFLLGPERTYPNMFDAHPPFQIDGNFGGAAAIAEMLMQSRGNEILLLPALPAAWPTGSITGLRARGACRVDLAWRGARLQSATLRSDIAIRKRVRLGQGALTVDLRPGVPRRLTAGAFRA
ncbi:glycosyl hydrolase family 95 catalytic domain-containing protein [Phenylobacterium deserti]|uniref:Glycoside hydrolase family 95 protein n=1 Tax=Phenylobacterium deserti TaxID=1914756 RepID=A0A328AFI1_9CAUL|nr:glycoside hydrolase family 95 protein [Phenylobacterium deserti]RAK52174.1 glycoside hydrolase family 95 protein [Phenylobacterium deserti]